MRYNKIIGAILLLTLAIVLSNSVGAVREIELYSASCDIKDEIFQNPQKNICLNKNCTAKLQPIESREGATHKLILPSQESPPYRSNFSLSVKKERIRYKDTLDAEQGTLLSSYLCKDIKNGRESDKVFGDLIYLKEQKDKTAISPSSYLDFPLSGNHLLPSNSRLAEEIKRYMMQKREKAKNGNNIWNCKKATRELRGVNNTADKNESSWTSIKSIYLNHNLRGIKKYCYKIPNLEGLIKDLFDTHTYCLHAGGCGDSRYTPPTLSPSYTLMALHALKNPTAHPVFLLVNLFLIILVVITISGSKNLKRAIIPKWTNIAFGIIALFISILLMEIFASLFIELPLIIAIAAYIWGGLIDNASSPEERSDKRDYHRKEKNM